MQLGRTIFGCGVALLLALGGCARLPDTGITALKSETLGKLQRHLLDTAPDMEQFRVRGPFEVEVREDLPLQLSSDERVAADFYLAGHKDPAPLIVLLHGYGNSKEDHAYQAYHLASWGMHSLAVELPSEGPWLDNGRTLRRIVALIQRHPEVVDRRIDRQRMILVGHSFGGSAVAIALAEGAPAAGAILLDPAGIGRQLPGYLRKIRTSPVLILASDARVNLMRQRGDFYRYIGAPVAEISVTHAHHEDAQFPFDSARFGDDSYATEEHQITFASALTAAAFSLAFTGNLDYAWGSFAAGVKSGKLLDPLRRATALTERPAEPKQEPRRGKGPPRAAPGPVPR